MNFIVGGGVHEHGRNCFFVQSDINYIVDCGVMRGAEQPYPHLTHSQIKSAKYLFLTHMHEDHTGAFSYLIENGFSGTVVASKETLLSLPVYARTMALPETNREVELDGAIVNYGRSGHCVGALWYEIRTNESAVLFSGDYCENTCYCVDKIRGRVADLAVLDCAFGNLKYDRTEQQKHIIAYVHNALKRGTVLLPVPKNGRATDIIWLLRDFECNFCVDEKLCAFFADASGNDFWMSEQIVQGIEERICRKTNADNNAVCLVADAQLAAEKSRKIAQTILDGGGSVLFTGHSDEGSFARELIMSGKAQEIAYNAHSSIYDNEILEKHNSFARVVYNHSDSV